MDRGCLQPVLRRVGPRRRQPLGPLRAQGHAPGGPRRVRPRQPGRRPHRRSGPAHRRAGSDGRGLGDGVPLDVVAHLQRVHPARRTGAGDRPVGRDHRSGHRAGPDRRRLAARALGLARHLLCDGAGRRAGRRPRRTLRPHLTRSARPAHRSPRVRPLQHHHRAARLHDHRGAGPWLGEHAHPDQLRGGRCARRRVRRLGAPHPGADARPEPVRKPALHRRQRLGGDLLLRPLGVHLPRHPVLPVPQGLRAAVHRRPAPAGGVVRGHRLHPRRQGRRPRRDQARRRRGPGVDGGVLPVGDDHLGAHRLRDHRRPDGGPGHRDGAHQRARDRGDHRRRAPRQGRDRLGDQRHDPPAGRHPRGGRDRQRLRVALRQSAHRSCSRPACRAPSPAPPTRRSAPRSPPRAPCATAATPPSPQASTTPRPTRSSTASVRPTISLPASPWQVR